MPRCAECKAPTCWMERTKLEKCLILTLILTGAFALAITSAYIASILINKKSLKEKEMKMSKSDVCETPSCIFAAKAIIEAIDPTISPCENFYDFACGNFLKNTIIPEDQGNIDFLSPVKEKITKQIKTVLEEPLRKEEPKAFQLMKMFYKTCMDTDAIEKNGLNTIRSLLKDLGGWPILEGDNWVESKFDWKELSYKLQNIGFDANPLMQVFVDTHFENSSRRVIIITDKPTNVQPSFRKRSLTEEDFLKAYFRFMVDTTVLLGADKNKSINEIKDILHFQLKLWDLQNKAGKSDIGEEKMSVNQLQHKILNISWVDYINKLLAPYDVTISGNEDVFIFRQEYFKGLGSLLSTVSKRTLANYIMWEFVHFCTSYSNKDLIEAKLKFIQVMSGVASQPARWIVCVENYLGGTVGIDRASLNIGSAALFVRKYFNNKTKQDAQEMVANIHHSLQDTMKSINWMDTKTKKHALDKLKAMSIDTAYPDELLDDKKLEEFYGNLDLDENNYLKSFLKFSQFDLRNHYRRLRVPVNRNDWISRGVYVSAINAFYLFLENVIHIPASVLQGQMFDINRPHYLNYGGVGPIIGHEITHGFDTVGSTRDKYGNKFDWWTPSTKNLFLKKSQCFVEQYNKYVVPELNLTVNGNKTLRENIADNGGFAVSYKAYQELIRKQGADKTLPGLNYTQNQLFWIAIANTWCSKARIEHQRSQLLNDRHAPNRFRVIGLLSNNKDFSKDFHCPSDSKMNPKHKCKLW